jgi:hypothetical protein
VAFTFGASTTINGSGTLTNTASQTLALNGATINADLVNQGTLIARGNSTINGALTTGAGSTLRVQGDNSVGSSALTVSLGFTNSAALELTSSGGGFNATLSVGSGTLTNNGTLTAFAGTGGTRTITGTLVNGASGSITIASGGTGTLGVTGNFTNQGTVNVKLGGTGQGTTYDQLNVSGTMTLGGTLVATLVNSFTPTSGATFDVVTGGSIAPGSNFGTYTLPSGAWLGGINGNNVRLTAP